MGSRTRPDIHDEDTSPGSARRDGCIVGQRYGERFTIVRELARGGMGIVYLALDEQTRAVVAFKVLRSEYEERHSVTQRFMAEAEFLCTFPSEHIPRGHASGVDPECGPYVAMELLEGKPLDELYGAAAWSPVRVAELGVKIAEAMAVIHQAGILHLDLKPENLFLSRSGTEIRVKILDWGISRMRGAIVSVPTEEETPLGTVRYMSPEQIRGERTGPQSDIYSLCVILYELLARRFPWGDDASPNVTLPELGEWFRTGLVAYLPGINPRVSETFWGALNIGLSRFTEQRYPSMAQLAKVMRIVQDDAESNDDTVFIPVKAGRTLADEIAEPSKRDPGVDLAIAYGLGAPASETRQRSNAMAAASGASIAVRQNDVELADLTHTLPIVTRSSGVRARQPVVAPVEPVETVEIPRPKWVLEVVLQGPLLGKRFAMSSGAHVIGRGTEATFVLDDLSVSARHAMIETTATGALVVTDLGSRNGTLVNGVPLEAGVPQAVRSGSRITVGYVVMMLR